MSSCSICINPALIGQQSLGPRAFPAKGFSYEVQRGETIEKIAGIAGSNRIWILRANNLKNSSELSAGMILFIPLDQAAWDEDNYVRQYSTLLEMHMAGEGGEKVAAILGLMLLHGDGVKKDKEKGLEYLRQASNAGDAAISFILADFETTAEGYAKAMLKAAKQGHLTAAEKMGYSYLNGIGVPVDKVQAWQWLLSVALRSQSISVSLQGNLNILREDLSLKDLERGMIQASNFVYIETRSAHDQKEFEANNPGFDGRITADNIHYADGELIIRAERSN